MTIQQQTTACTSCLRPLSEDQFYLVRNGHGKRQDICRDCAKAQGAWWQKLDHEKELAKARSIRYNNSGKGKATQARYQRTEKCKEHARRYRKSEKGKETLSAWRRQRYANRTPEQIKIDQLQASTYLAAHRKFLYAKARARRQADKERALQIYGDRCACCGEAGVCFLTFDHINDDGYKHRKEMGTSDIAKWLRMNNYPTDVKIQILCYNCNMAKQHDPIGHCQRHPNAHRIQLHVPEEYTRPVQLQDGMFRIVQVKVINNAMFAFVDSKPYKLTRVDSIPVCSSSDLQVKESGVLSEESN